LDLVHVFSRWGVGVNLGVGGSKAVFYDLPREADLNI